MVVDHFVICTAPKGTGTGRDLLPYLENSAWVKLCHGKTGCIYFFITYPMCVVHSYAITVGFCFSSICCQSTYAVGTSPVFFGAPLIREHFSLLFCLLLYDKHQHVQ